MRKKLESIVLSGEVTGHIWEPGRICSKQFAVKLAPYIDTGQRPWKSIREALEGIVEDHDFQYCYIDYCMVRVTYATAPNRIEVVTSELNQSAKLIKDLFTEDNSPIVTYNTQGE